MIAKPQARTPLTPLNILFVDEHADCQRTFRTALEWHGHHVMVAGSATEAIALAAASDRVDLLITEAFLADGSAPRLLEQVTRAAGRHVHALIVSGFDPTDGLPDYISAGFCDYLTKPVKPERLCEVIERCFA